MAEQTLATSVPPHYNVLQVRWSTVSNHDVFILVHDRPGNRVKLFAHNTVRGETNQIAAHKYNYFAGGRDMYVMPGDEHIILTGELTVHCFDVKARREMQWWPNVRHRPGLSELLLSNDGKYILCNNVTRFNDILDKRCVLLTVGEPEVNYVAAECFAAAFVWDSRSVLCIEGAEGVVRRRYLGIFPDNSRPIAHIVHHEWNSRATCVACSPVSGAWCVGDNQGMLAVYSADTDEFGQPIRQATIVCFSPGYNRAVPRVMFTSTGNTIVVPTTHMCLTREAVFVPVHELGKQDVRRSKYTFRPLHLCEVTACTDGYIQLQVKQEHKECCVFQWHGDRADVAGPALKTMSLANAEERAGGFSRNGCQAMTFTRSQIKVTRLLMQQWSPKMLAHLYSPRLRLAIQHVAIWNWLFGFDETYFQCAAQILQLAIA